MCPSRADGTPTTMMSKQLIMNASLSRRDALIYRTNSSVSYSAIATEYGEDFFEQNSDKNQATQMYELGGAFYTCIESLRHDTANGMVHGEVIDSEENYSVQVFLQSLLQYCQMTGVQVISKKEAYDICFGDVYQTGNLIYNPTFRNTVEEFIPDAENIPQNPDGYIGDCYVSEEQGNRILNINGDTSYLHYGIPLGDMKYQVIAKGQGNINIYAIKNSDNIELENDNLQLLNEIAVDSQSYEVYSGEFFIPDNPEREFEQICEGLGDKIMGIKIVYSGSLAVEDITLEKIISE